ncbi:MAG: DUF4252 domain-containing protein [Prevotella sp.]|nr:DUF4252 domain-containing protein [Prevotella sp.]
MKRLIILILVAELASATLKAQSVSDVINRFRAEQGVVYLHADKQQMKEMTIGDGPMEIDGLLKMDGGWTDVDSLCVLILDSVSSEVSRRFANIRIPWQAEGYGEFLKAAKGTTQVAVYTKPNGNRLREMVLFITDEDGTAALIQLFGNIDPKVLHNLSTK